MNFFLKYDSFIGAFFVLIIYAITSAPTIIHLDAGELTTVQATLGIAHPTGYPLFTIIGFIVLKIFFFIKPVLILNFLASFFCAAGVFVIIKLTKLIIDNFDLSIRKNKKINLELTQTQKSLSAITVGLIVGFSQTFWFQSTSVEVYSLHLVLISLILYSSLTAYFSSKKKYWYFTALFLSLGFSNHMTTVMILPGLAFLFFKNNGFNKSSFILIFKMLLIFIPLLILIYSYIPIRAMQNPVLNWGNPIDVERFLRHVSGKQYQVWIFSGMDVAKKQFLYFIKNLPTELGILGLVLSLASFPITFKKSKVISIFLLINILTAVAYSINYDIVDIDSYFLLAYISLALLSLGLISSIASRLKNQSVYTILIIPLFMIVYNFNTVDQSKNFAIEDYTKAILNKTEKNGIVLSYLWDNFVSPSYYFNYVEGYRSDVSVIDKELIRRSWYYDQLKNNYPAIIENVDSEYRSFLSALEPFENDQPYDANFIENNFRNLLTNLISQNINARSFYITPEFINNELKTGELTLPSGYTIVPMELSFKVVPDNNQYVNADPTKISIRFSDNPDKYEIQMKNLVVNMMLFRTMYELQYNHIEKAKRIVTKLQKEYPEYRISQTILDQIEIN